MKRQTRKEKRYWQRDVDWHNANANYSFVHVRSFCFVSLIHFVRVLNSFLNSVVYFIVYKKKRSLSIVRFNKYLKNDLPFQIIRMKEGECERIYMRNSSIDNDCQISSSLKLLLQFRLLIANEIEASLYHQFIN